MKALLILLIPVAHAQVTLQTGIRASFPAVMTAIVNFLAGSALAVCTAVFFIGAFRMVAYAAKPDKATKGKDIMLDALKGFAIILGSYGILRTLLFLIAG